MAERDDETDDEAISSRLESDSALLATTQKDRGRLSIVDKGQRSSKMKFGLGD